MIERFAKKCKTTIPKEDKNIFYSCENPNNIPENISIEYAYNLCEKLKSEGVEDFHIYTLNKLKTTSKLLKILITHTHHDHIAYLNDFLNFVQRWKF